MEIPAPPTNRKDWTKIVTPDQRDRNREMPPINPNNRRTIVEIPAPPTIEFPQSLLSHSYEYHITFNKQPHNSFLEALCSLHTSFGSAELLYSKIKAGVSGPMGNGSIFARFVREYRLGQRVQALYFAPDVLCALDSDFRMMSLSGDLLRYVSFIVKLDIHVEVCEMNYTGRVRTMTQHHFPERRSKYNRRRGSQHCIYFANGHWYTSSASCCELCNYDPSQV